MKTELPLIKDRRVATILSEIISEHFTGIISISLTTSISLTLSGFYRYKLDSDID